ncbi:ComEA family DNA-binding protein [Pseudarthrobacter cellobiosi]|uniref:ComEA family DNA-binding protein n=1 Tax=Pseudarthrobacter cellobiosi TaxID=2953654 RepID=UPI00208FD131|nr:MULTISPECIES: ComEA family DNA-binding protein [unclassified Pseudarthrobacter]MCO4254537.1 ComEA family DNA-binding protein [Pseudarthrobacter sp. HLT1-5]MCO4274080.1 ComEA family DNA-binding protein [Pseudarthrobacter sp. HLT3-5]
MSRRDAGAARQGARHARDRLQSTLGAGPGLLLTDSGEKVFEYDGGAHVSGDASASGAADESPPGTGKTGPALRWRVGVRVALLIAALAVLGGAWFWSQVADGQPEVMPLSDISAQGSLPAGERTQGQEPPGAGPPELPAESPQAGIVIIHVAGAVAVPGVVQLPAGSRVHQAVAAAGGGAPSADLNRLNLAAVLTDGQKLYVPQAGEEIPAGSSGPLGESGEGTGSGGTASAGGKVNLNTAGVEELDALPKVGPVLAQRIVDWRKEHGPFKSIEELDAVDGVGPKMLETLLPLVGV